MSYLSLGPMFENITPGALNSFFRRIEHAVNTLDKTNFPRPLDGSVLKLNSTPGTALKDYSTPLKKLAQPKIYIPLCLPAQAFTTTSTTPVNVGPYFGFNPSDWPSGGWYLEATIYVSNAAAICTCELYGTSVIGSVTTQSTSPTRVVSAALTMPTAEGNIWVRLMTSNASYAAGFLGARLIFAP